MKKVIYILLIALGLNGASFSYPPPTLASTAPGFEICDGVAEKTNACKDVATQQGDDKNPVVRYLKVGLNILAFIAGAAAVVLLIVNGLRLILSNGDASGVSSARSGLIYVVIGIVVVVLAQSIVIFLLDNI